MTRVEQRLKKKGGPLLGTCVQTYHPEFVELAGMIGFDVIWIDMEHPSLPVAKAADLCRTAAGVGMLTMIRVPNARRDWVLKAAECGPDIIDLPMANSVETAEELVANAKYSPEGNRGSFLSSRAMRYGLDDIVDQQRRVNDELCLLIQIETKQAVEHAEELSSVPGVNGIFVGPADLSASLGHLGNEKHPTVQQSIERVIRMAKGSGNLTALPSAPADVSKWARAGVDIIFCGSEISLLRLGLQSCLRGAREALLNPINVAECAEYPVYCSDSGSPDNGTGVFAK